MTQPMMDVPPRSQVPEKDKWDPTSVFADRQAWEQARDGIRDGIETVRAFRGRLAEGPEVLLEGLQRRDDLIQLAEHSYVYAGLFHMPDMGDSEATAMFSQAVGQYAEVQAAVSFFEPELLQIGKGTLDAWLDASPELSVYRHYLDDLFRMSEHVRSDEVEELLGMLGEPFDGPSGIAGQLTNVDFKFVPAVGSDGQERALTQGSYRRLLAGDDRDLRRSAWTHFNELYHAHKHTLATTLLASMKQDVFGAKARHYPNTLDASLFADNIPREVYKTLIDTFIDQTPVWHRYFHLRKRLLGVDELHPYDIWAPLTSERPEVTFEQAVEWICAGLAPMGEDYVETVRRGCLEERWVDIYPNQGKRDGAFSFGTRGTHPFIQMNFIGTLSSMSTLAHELGHSMHSYLTWSAQPMVYADYTLFVAETASNFHQALVRDHLLKSAGDESFHIAVIEEAMGNFHRYMLIMPTLARFELEVHERLERGEGVNVDDLVKLCVELYKEAYGDAMVVNEAEAGMLWAQYLHLYRNYYVFQYATGISAAHALAERVLAGGAQEVDDYQACLRAGGSLYPLDTLRMAGVDPAQADSVRAGFRKLEEYVVSLEEQFG